LAVKVREKESDFYPLLFGINYVEKREHKLIKDKDSTSLSFFRKRRFHVIREARFSESQNE